MRRLIVFWGALAGLLLACERWLTSCVGAAPCLGSAAEPRAWLAMGLDAGAVLLAVTTLATAVRACWLLVACGWEARRLSCADCPAGLANLALSLGIQRIRLLAADRPMAFCVGAARPAVYVSRGACARLEPVQLEAVLLHELDHAGRREPLRRALTRAACEVAFFLPVLGWLHERLVERSELKADLRAIDRLGPRPVAAALWTLDSQPWAAAFPGFAGASQLRAAQLLGDSIPHRPPRPSLLAASLMGALFALAIVNCAAEIVATSLR